MQILDVTGVGSDYKYRWPSGHDEVFTGMDYRAIANDGDHHVRIGFGTRHTYGRARKRVVVWIDEHPHAEFLGADDFDRSGDLVCEIKVASDPGEKMCRYPDQPVPERYSGLAVVGLPLRVTGPGVHHAWAAVANIADHRTMLAMAALRRTERDR